MNLRKVVAHILVSVIKEGCSLTAVLEIHLSTINNPKEKAFIQALSYGVLRDYHQLEYLLGLLLTKPLRHKETDIKVLILMGLHQLRTMRVKTHAAVSETVAAVGKKSWAKRVINGVLRQYLRGQSSLEAQIAQHPIAPYSHPEWLIKKIQQDWGEQAPFIFEQNNRHPPMVLRVNLSKTTQIDYGQLLTKNNIAAEIISFNDTAIQLTDAVTVDALPYFKEGWVSVQDTAAQLATSLLQLETGQKVLDLCAAPGGKTAAMLERQPSLKVTAVDIDETRLLRVNDNLQRLQLSATVIKGDARHAETWWDGTPFDRILLDAPCSALGVIRRHPDIKILRRRDDIDTLVKLQTELLEAAWCLLASGGRLLYATCSLLKQENQHQIAQFLKNHSDSFEIPIQADWGFTQTVGRQILTGEHSMDGFYYARLGKH